jgi:hypothetical protein
MPDPTTVWMVHLGRGAPTEIRGTIRTDDDALVFEHEEKPAALRFPFSRIARVRRILGSPVVIVEWREDDDRRRTAFYFAKPPPLQPSERAGADGALPSLAERRARSKRRHRRASLGYLAASGGRTKRVVKAWTAELRIRTRAARG